ncbi:tyrosine-type recombinase/integrase [Duganella sp. FT135W]|uniref:Tyrosine-type recombinase/integrase n=1 Tax=Duganella flavida TaxID=2692175 RepID=A0A6L8K532_9BURK|nr:site-specific integrase [Duganella flavida]MYM22599.1 tyrosine-type recombinase/integrase [Duganella flavida]
MLSDLKLKNLKPRERLYKLADRDGLYVAVLPSGGISFRFNYRVNGRQETVTLGRYGIGGMTLAEARSALAEARKTLTGGDSPARNKNERIQHKKAEETFAVWVERWLEKHRMAESTRDMRRWTYEHDLKKPLGALLLSEVTEQRLRELCDRIVDRKAPAVAVHAREIVLQVFRYADSRGVRHPNPALGVRPMSIATFVPRDRTLSPNEIRWFYKYLERINSAPTIKLACKMLLLTLVRKSELTEATWDEVDFERALWTIPGARMKRRNPHNVYLSSQAMDILVAFKTCAGCSRFMLPNRYDIDRPMSDVSMNAVLTKVVEAANRDGCGLAGFSPHDLRRTGSTLLHEAGYNTDWIEKCLAHEQKSVRAIYNKAEYAEQRRVMLQAWADMIDEWTA